jgi:hypothetical protein
MLWARENCNGFVALDRRPLFSVGEEFRPILSKRNVL